MGLAARPTAAGFVSSALTHTSPSHIQLCASLCATPRSLFHWKLAYIHCLILISHSVGSIKAKGNEPQAIRPGCCLPPAEGWTQSVHQPNPRRSRASLLTAQSCAQKFKAEPPAQQRSKPHQTSADWPEDQQKTTIINGNITPHSSSARFCIYIKERSVAKNYYCSLCKSQALQGKAFKLQGRQTHTARRVFLGVFSCVQLSRSVPRGKPDQAHILPACCVGFEIGASLHMVNHQIFFFLNFTNNCRLLSATVISICSTGFQQD